MYQLPYDTTLKPRPLSLVQLTYEFETWMLLQEPLLVIVALYLFFLLIIVIVRLDFSITTVSCDDPVAGI